MMTLMFALSSSLAASIVAKVTVTTAFSLLAVWLARRSRAAVRYALLAAGFGVLLALPVASLVVPPLRIAVGTAVQQRTLPAAETVTESIPLLVPYRSHACDSALGRALDRRICCRHGMEPRKWRSSW